MDEKQREQIALFRFGLISSLVSRQLAVGEKASELRKIASREHVNSFGESHKVSVRSLERYIQSYREGGFEALKPMRRGGYESRAISQEVLGTAIQLKKERPDRSVFQIVRMLELAKLVEPGQVSESTLSKQLRKHGATRKNLKQSTSGHHRRFEFPYRNACWQGDVQHTLYLPDPLQGNKTVTAKLFAFIDDYSRLIVHGEFYFEENSHQLEDCLQKAILRNGKPEKLYVDNGAIYRANVLELACARLGIKLVHSKAGRPQGRGKIERFFQFVDSSFKPEAYDLIESEKIKTIEQLNRYFHIWLDMMYHERKHGETKQTPKDRFELNDQTLVYPTIEEIKEAFLWEENRKVDKTGCIRFQNNLYEVEQELVGKTVTLRFDPQDLSSIEVWYEGKQYTNAAHLHLQRHIHDKINISLVESDLELSSGLNYLELAGPGHKEKQKEKRGKMSYSTLLNGENHA
jgi:putative transposase